MNTIVVAYNKNFAIGDSSGNIPWRIPEDLKFFKHTTMGKPCIMGRKTWDSIPPRFKPLVGRKNIVVTKKTDVFFQFNAEYVVANDNPIYFCSTIEKALERGYLESEEVCIVGGGEIYKYCLERNLVDRIVASEIKNYDTVDAKTYFPDLNNADWEKSLLREFDDFTVYEYKCIKQSQQLNTAQT